MDFVALAGTWDHMVNYAKSLAVAMEPPIPPLDSSKMLFEGSWRFEGVE